MTIQAASKWEDKVGKHAYAGSCAPPGSGALDAREWSFRGSYQETFSVGIFQWVLLASGRGVKRGPVKVRVFGPVFRAEEVAEKAREIVEALDNGSYNGPKRVQVK